MAPAGGAFHLAHVAVRTDAAFAEFGEELASKVWETACSRRSASSWTFHHSIPKSSANIAFDKVMAEGELAGDFCGRQR